MCPKSRMSIFMQKNNNNLLSFWNSNLTGKFSHTHTRTTCSLSAWKAEKNLAGKIVFHLSSPLWTSRFHKVGPVISYYLIRTWSWILCKSNKGLELQIRLSSPKRQAVYTCWFQTALGNSQSLARSGMKENLRVHRPGPQGRKGLKQAPQKEDSTFLWVTPKHLWAYQATLRWDICVSTGSHTTIPYTIHELWLIL